MDKIHAALGYPGIGKPIVKMKTFPMKFRVFLRHIFGGTRHAERLRLYRKYLLHQFEIEIYFRGHRDVHSPESRIAAAEKLRDDFIAKLSREGIKSIEWYQAVEPEIQRWRNLNRVAQRKAASKSRWDKEKSKKILELPKAEQTGVSQDEKCSLASKKSKKTVVSHPKK
jgi:hypothetical protein